MAFHLLLTLLLLLRPCCQVVLFIIIRLPQNWLSVFGSVLLITLDGLQWDNYSVLGLIKIESNMCRGLQFVIKMIVHSSQPEQSLEWEEEEEEEV